MPANLTPQYKKAEEQFRASTTDSEKLYWLEEMLRLIPKHKGTEHLQADIKRRMSKFKDSSSQKTHAKQVDIFHIPKTGAGQVALIGTPNCGKSSILGALTHAKVNIADYPFATTVPVPGMARFEDIYIQLIDTPPITADYAAPGQVGAYRNADLTAIVIDLSGDVIEQLQICLKFLDEHKLLDNPQIVAEGDTEKVSSKNTVVICTKSDIAAPDAFETLKQLCDRPFEFIEISARTGRNLNLFLKKLFDALKIIRIYAKPPGKPADMNEPFIIPRGSTVMDLARHIHRDLAEKFKSARTWGTGVHDGQNVHRTHILSDKDIIELHFG